MLQAIGLSKKQLIKMLRYEGLLYSLFATLVTLFLGTGLVLYVCRRPNQQIRTSSIRSRGR